MGVPLRDLIDPATEARLRAAAGADPDAYQPPPLPADEPVELEAKDGLGEMEHKADPVVAGATQVLEADAATGKVTAIVSVTGVEDRVKDVIEPGAYTKSIAKQEPIGVWSHDDKTWVARADSYRELMPGDPELKGLRLQDGSPWPAHAGAVIVDAAFNLETPHGAAAFSDVKFFQGKTSWSIGYRATKAHRNPRTGVRHIKELDWFEFSPVMVGANQHAMTLSVKSLAQGVDPNEAVGLVDDEVLVDVLTADELVRYSELKGDLELDPLETKGKARIIRTAAGARRFGGNIGDVIRADGTLERRDSGSARPGMVPDGRGGMKPGMVPNDRSADGGSKPRPAPQGVDDDDDGPSEFQRRAADGEPKVIGLANRGEKVRIRKDDHPLDGKVVTIGDPSGKYDVEVTDEDGKKHVIDTYVTALPARKAGEDAKPAASSGGSSSGGPKAVEPQGAGFTKTAAGQVDVGDEVDFVGMGPGGPSDPINVRGKVEAVDVGNAVVTLTVGGKKHKVMKTAPIGAKKTGAPKMKDDPTPGAGRGVAPEAARERDERAARASERERAAEAEGNRRTAERTSTDAQKLAAINKRRRAKGQPPLLRLPNEAKSLDLAETTDDELCALVDEPEVKGSRASLNRSPRKNWVEQAGDLPGYIREVARAVERDTPGMTLDRAIPIAIGRIKKWARGGGGVNADTVAKAAKAVAEWEALKAKAGKKYDSDLLDELEHKATAELDAIDAALATLEAAGVEVEVKGFDPVAVDEPPAGDDLADPDEVLALLQRGSELKAATGLVDISDLLAQRADLPEPPPFS